MTRRCAANRSTKGNEFLFAARRWTGLQNRSSVQCRTISSPRERRGARSSYTGSTRSRRRASSALADSVRATARAGQNVIHALDADVVAQHCAEDSQLRTAETLADCGSGTDRTVVLDQQEAV